MWEIIHWYFIYLVQPNAFFHVVATLLLYFASHVPIKLPKLSKKDILPGIALFCMYAGFQLSPKLEHLAFTPWWVVSMTGLRYREGFISLGGIIVGIYLCLSTYNDITGHILMNLSRMIHPLRMSLKARSIVHVLCTILYVYDPTIRLAEYKDFLAGASCVVTAMVKTRPDFFSLAMVFSSPVALCTFILHAMEINWYKYYRNNHFKRVKNSLYFIYPIVIVSLAYGVNVFSYVPAYTH